MSLDQEFKFLLANIEYHDKNYKLREVMVYTCVALAKSLGLGSGFRIDPAEPEWPVAYIELPTGQVSWHMPQYPATWDGHSSDEKYERIRRYVFGDKPPAN